MEYKFYAKFSTLSVQKTIILLLFFTHCMYVSVFANTHTKTSATQLPAEIKTEAHITILEVCICTCTHSHEALLNSQLGALSLFPSLSPSLLTILFKKSGVVFEWRLLSSNA